MTADDHAVVPAFLDDEERALLEGYEGAWDRGHYGSAPARAADIEKARAIARATMNSTAVKITTRLAQNDLTALKARALEQGIPYQTLLASVVHQYVEGRLIEADKA